MRQVVQDFQHKDKAVSLLLRPPSSSVGGIMLAHSKAPGVAACYCNLAVLQLLQ